MNNSRRTAAFIFARWLATRDYPANLLPEGTERAFVQDLVYTAIRRFRPLGSVLRKLVKKWPKGEMEALLYIGAAQILYMDDVPDFAAVNETVEAAKECSNPSVAKTVNAVLRNVIRKRDEFISFIASSPVEERESMPGALYRRWTARFGAENAEKLALWHNEPAETYLAYPDGNFTKLERGRRVSDVEGFNEGAFIVQDPATGLAIGLMDAKEGESVLDACAAPGGKTIQLAWRGAKVSACEVNPRRRRKLAENLNRTGLSGKVAILDSLEPCGLLFDKILVDAPCSNTGVFRRKPDARWNWSEEKLKTLQVLQSEILDKAAKLLKPGGTLVYSTCSNETEENDARIDAFLASHPGFCLVEKRESLPFETGHDGAFAAALKRNEA